MHPVCIHSAFVPNRKPVPSAVKGPPSSLLDGRENVESVAVVRGHQGCRPPWAELFVFRAAFLRSSRAGPLVSVPVSMICPPNVRRSTIAAQRRGSGNVFDQPENASFEAIASEFFTDVAPCVEDRADRGFSAGVGSRIGRGGRCSRAVATLPPIIRERTIFRPCYAPPSDMDVTVRVEQPSGAACPAKRSSTQRRAAGVALIARLTCSLVWSRV